MVTTTKPSSVIIVQTRSGKQNPQTNNPSTSQGLVETNTVSNGNSATVNITSTGTGTETVQGFNEIVTDYFSNSMAGTLRLEAFKGECGEDVEKFLRRFDQYCACMNFREAQAFAQLSWHLDGVARLYVESLSPAPRTLDELKNLLRTKFKMEKPVSLNIFGMKQEATENAEQFLSRLEAETFKTVIGDDLQVQIALNGLHPSVSSAISTHGPTTLSEVRSLARRLTNVRQAAPVSAASSSFEDTVNILSAAVAQLTTVMTRQQEQQQQPQPQRNQGRSYLQARRQPPQLDGRTNEAQTCSRCGVDWSKLMLFLISMVLCVNVVSGKLPNELQRLNYGVVFEPLNRIHLATESWTHTFALELPKDLNLVDLTGCTQTPKTCKVVNEVLLEINQIRQETEVKINATIDSIYRLIPEKKLTMSRSRSRRSLLPFIGKLSKSLFGTATSEDVEMLAKHINALNKLSRTMAQNIEQHDNNLASYMHTMDDRISNIVTGMKENELAIQHIQTQLYDSFNNLEQSFSTMNVLMAKQIEKSRMLEHSFNELLMGVYNLVEGKLSPHIIPVSVMETTMTSIQNILHGKFTGHYLISESLSEIYKMVDFVFARQGSKLYISVKFPVASFAQPLSLYKILAMPVPVNSTSNHATKLLGLPETLAVTSNLKYYTTFDLSELNQCKFDKVFVCKFSKALSPISHETCISALFKGDKLLIKNKCDFRFLINHLSAKIVQLSHTSVLIYNVDTLQLDCKMGRKVEKGCTFCIINVPCECSISTETIYLPPRLTACHENTTSVLHPVNLALLQQFFNDTDLKNIASNSLFANPLSVEIPQFQIYNHSMQNIIADDRKAHLSLEKMAQSAKDDTMVFQSMTDPLLSGDIVLQDDWPTTDNILLYCTIAVVAVGSLIIILISIKLRKALIILSVMQNTSIKTVQAATVPTLKYKKQTTTQLPTDYFWENLDIPLDHYIFAFTIVTMILVAILLIRNYSVRCSDTQIIAEITNGVTCLHFPLHNLSLCPNYWKITVPQDISCIQVQGLWNPVVTFTWDGFQVQNLLNEEIFHVTPGIKVNCLKSKQLRHIMKSTYSVHFYVKHKNLLIPQY